MKVERKHIIIGLISLVSISGALLYLEYKKLMDYAIKFKSVVVKKVSLTKVNFDLFLYFTNKSNLKITIKNQNYTIYVNDKPVSTVQNSSGNLIKPRSTDNIVGVNVQFNPQTVYRASGLTSLEALAKAGSIKLKFDIKLGVSLYGIAFNIPYVYETTLKELISPTQPTT